MSFTSTPRQPLMDLRQVNRLVPADDVTRKPVTPIYTPRNTAKHRKKKSSLAFEDKENAGCENIKKDVCESRPSNDMCILREIEEENVDQFVSQVLNKCVRDLDSQQTVATSTNDDSKDVKETEINPYSVDESSDSDLNHVTDNIKENFNSELVGFEAIVEKVSVSLDNVTLNEEELLGNVSQLSKSLADSTKSEEELLASFVQTPCVTRAVDTEELQRVDDVDVELGKTKENEKLNSGNTHDSYKGGSLPSSEAGPNFLEKVALMQRVNKATSSLASWVFPPDKQGYHVHWVPKDGSAKVMHSVACSPMPQTRGNNSDTHEAKSELPPQNVNNNAESCSAMDELTVNQSALETSVDLGFDASHMTNASVITCSHLSDGATDTCVDCSLAVQEHEHQQIMTILEGMKENTSLLDDIEQGIQTLTPEMPSKHTQDGSMHSVACSPILAPTCEVSIQNEVETHSIQCSPFRIDSHDISIQYETNTHSFNCSPIRFESHNVSIQNTAETQSTMCSPVRLPQNDVSIQFQPDLHSVMCSPIPAVPVHDISIQNVVGTQSVTCSPMVPRADQDKSVLASGPECEDQCVGTDIVTYTEVSVSVQPEQCTQGTEMDDSLMTTSSTSMTPIKLEKKNGKKLTAEDVRKQHPRVLANELETLRMENARLETHMLSLEKDRKRLVAQEELQQKLEDTKTELSVLQNKYTSEQTEWKTRCEGLHAEISSLETNHQTQMMKMKEDYESTNYRDHFFASQKLVRELQTELDQYNKLVDDLEQAHSLQNEFEQAVSEGFSKVQEKADWIKTQYRLNQEKGEDLERLISQYQTQLHALGEDQVELAADRELLNNTVASVNDEKQRLDGELKKTSLELEETTVTVERLTEEKDTALKDKCELSEKHTIVTEEKTRLQQERDFLTEEVKLLQEKLCDHQQQLEQAQHSLKEETEKYGKTNTQLTENLEKKNLLGTNLQRTLDNRENEIDMLERDLFECREIIYTQLEAIKTLETGKRQSTAELGGFKAEVRSLKESLSTLREKEQDIRCKLEVTEKELDGTKQTASRLIRQREMEINDCSNAITQLTCTMSEAAIKEADSAGSSPADACNQAASSLVSQILNAAHSLQDNVNLQSGTAESSVQNSDILEKSEGDHGQTGASLNDQNRTECPFSQSRKKLEFSGNSAFKPVGSAFVPVVGAIVQNTTKQKTEQNGQENSSRGGGDNNMQVKENNNVSRKEYSKKSVSFKLEDSADREQGETLSDQMGKVTDVFDEVVRVAHLIEKALRSSLNDITFENEDLQSQANQCELVERRVKADLQVTQMELEKSRSETIKLREQIEEMGERFGEMLDQQVEIQRYKEEVVSVQSKLKMVESERELLNTQISELLQKMETGGHNSGAVDVISQREILALQKKVDKFRNRLTEKDELIEQLSSKASKRIHKLEANWTKADAEVCRLDELVDAVRSELVTHQLAGQDEKLTQVIAVIDGREALSTISKKGSKSSRTTVV